MHSGKFDIHLCPIQFHRPLPRLRKIQKRKDLVARRHTVHGDMKKRAEKTQRDKKFRRQQNEHQRSVYAHRTFHELRKSHDHPHCCPAVGDDIHHAGGVELHGQHLHGDPPEPLGFLVHLRRFHLIRTVDLQSSQSLEVFKEAVSQFRVYTPVFVQQPLRDLLHRHDGDRDQRHADQKHQARLPVYK